MQVGWHQCWLGDTWHGQCVSNTILKKINLFQLEANYFIILYWFYHTSTWIRHRCTHVPHPEPPSQLPSHTTALGHPSAPAPSILYRASNLDWHFVSHIIFFKAILRRSVPWRLHSPLQVFVSLSLNSWNWIIFLWNIFPWKLLEIFCLSSPCTHSPSDIILSNRFNHPVYVTDYHNLALLLNFRTLGPMGIIFRLFQKLLKLNMSKTRLISLIKFFSLLGLPSCWIKPEST